MIANQLKRQSDDLLRLRASLDTKTESENRLEKQVRESKRQYADLESRMKEEIMMARIRDAENTQRVAELTQKISGLECKVGYTYAWIFMDRYRIIPDGVAGFYMELCSSLLLFERCETYTRNENDYNGFS